MEKIADVRQRLLGYLGGDKEKLEHYEYVLENCCKPFDVADRVIRPMYVEDGLSADALNREAFYGAVAELATLRAKKEFKAKSLYYHINENVSEWKKARDERLATLTMQQNTDYVDIQIQHHPDGSLDTVIRIHHAQTPEAFNSWLNPYMEVGYALLKQKTIKRFRGRGVEAVIEVTCMNWLAIDLLNQLQQSMGEVNISYQSPYTIQPEIRIEEAIEIAEAEQHEH